VSIGTSPRSAVRTLVAATLVVGGALALPGCGNDRYSDSLRYGLRTDVMVIDTPKTDLPTHLDPPGALNEWLASLKSRGATVLNPKDLDAGQRRELDTTLDKIFGTPAHPKVEGLDPEVIIALKLETDPKAIEKHQWPYLEQGSQLFRRHCLHCHGITGNGQGPTAAWVNPHPRDYRRGIFKFTSSKQPTGTRKPRREDLVRTLTQGIEGTSMPAFGGQSGGQFGVLGRDDLDRLVSYVIHLSLRGQTEWETLDPLLHKAPLEDEDGNSATVAEYAASRVKVLAGYWADADKNVIRPEGGKTLEREELQASIQRGFDLFVLPGDASCIKCHMDFGRRNNFLYDTWGTIVRPMDLTQGVFRGGRRPIDIYWRMHAGINGAGMPAFDSSLKPDQIWDIVNFVEALPYPQMLPEKVRAQVYTSQEPGQEQERGAPAALAPRRPAAKLQAQE
jgi:mono/diheme cytochrome c family protein